MNLQELFELLIFLVLVKPTPVQNYARDKKKSAIAETIGQIERERERVLRNKARIDRVL